jgi:hypothetical protein
MLKPSRELDALIAEKVMGWKLEEHFGLRRWVWKLPADQLINGLQWIDNPLPFSEEISSAWQVVEKLKSDERDFKIWFIGNWQASFGSPGIGESNSAPHAICLAALKALV